MPTPDEINNRVKRELLLALKVERSASSLYQQKLNELVKMYSSLLSPYWRNGEFNTILYNRDKVYSPIFNQKLKELNDAISAFAALAGTETAKNLSGTLEFSYSRVMKDTFKDMGRIVPLELRTPDSVRKAVAANFSDGKTFSSRIWSSTTQMEAKLRATLDNAILTGQSIPNTAKEFAEVTGQSYYNARRVIRTETIATYSRASLDGYRALGIEEVKVLESQAADDDICSPFNGKIVKVQDAKIGYNIPPFHPHCRGTVAPVIK